MTDLINKLPEELRAKYAAQACECCDVVECLKVAAVLKLWCDRGYRDVEFCVPLVLGRKKFFVDVLARKGEVVVGVECMPSLNLGWLRGRMRLLRRCLGPDTYFVIVFPSTVGKRVDKAAFLADEVWVTDEDNGKVERMMFVSVCHKE
ncbi:MAG: hypothetical protein ACQCN6_12630 [Candidatus Bathyarchaeia archaeon]|jgi:hypothetical protein